MKRLFIIKYTLILFLVFVSNLLYGQIIFNNCYESQGSPWNGWSQSIGVVEGINSYLYLDEFDGLTSVEKVNGNNPTVEVNFNSLAIKPDGYIKYNAIDASSQNLFFGLAEIYPQNTAMLNVDMIVVKTDINNNILWDYRLTTDTTGYIITSIKATLDGGCVVGGNVQAAYQNSSGEYIIIRDAFLMKLSANGTLDWMHEFNMPYFEEIEKLTLNPDGSIFIVGKFDHLLCSVGSLWISRFSNNGSQLWEQFIDPVIEPDPWGGQDNTIRYEIFPEDILLTDTKIILVGAQNLGYTTSSGSFLGDEESYLLELGVDGNIINDTLYNHVGTSSIESICEKNNEYFIVHRAYSLMTDNDDYYISKLNSNNNIDTLAIIPNAYCGDSHASGSIIDNDGNLIFTGFSGNQTGCYKPWLVKYGFTPSNLTELNFNQPKELIKIVNLLGQEVEYTPNTVLIYQYSDGTSEKVFTIED